MTAMPTAAQPVSPHVGAAPRPPTGDVGLGIMLMLAFVVIAPVMDIFAKLATSSLPPGEITLARFAIQGLVLLPVVIWRGATRRGGVRRLTVRMALLHGLRGLLVAVATVCFITAISVMSVADAIAIFFVEPLLLTVLGGLALGERVGWRRYVACAVGFAGALIVVRPSFDELGWIAMLPLGTALGFAFYLVLTRRLAQYEDPFAMQAYSGLAGALCVAVALWVGAGSMTVFDPVWPDARGWLLMAAVGAVATISHLFLVFAFKNAPASTLAPFQYLEIVAATGFGYLVFGDFPDALKWLGIAIIVGSGLYVFWRERLATGRGAL